MNNYIDKFYKLLCNKSYVYPHVNEKENISIVLSYINDNYKAELEINFYKNNFRFDEYGQGQTFEEAVSSLFQKVEAIMTEIKEKEFEIDRIDNEIVMKKNKKASLEEDWQKLVSQCKGRIQ